MKNQYKWLHYMSKFVFQISFDLRQKLRSIRLVDDVAM